MKSVSSSRCKRCNRVLKDPIAQSRGYGSVCWKQHLKDSVQRNSLFNLLKSKNN